MNAMKTMHGCQTISRRLMAGLLFAGVAVVGGCVGAPPVVTTTTERTTTQTQQTYPQQTYQYYATPSGTVTTTRTQQYTP
jgi:hypothetical protein